MNPHQLRVEQLVSYNLIPQSLGDKSPLVGVSTCFNQRMIVKLVIQGTDGK